jgi:hypothetical protein
VVEEVKNKFSACKQFFNMEIEARVVAAALNILEINTTDDKPAENFVPPSLETASLATKREFLKDLSSRIVDKFILHEDKVNTLIKDLENYKGSSDSNGRYPCRYPGCTKTFSHDGKRCISHEKTHGLHEQTSQSTLHNDTSIASKNRDDMLNYQYALLEYGMLFLRRR